MSLHTPPRRSEVRVEVTCASECHAPCAGSTFLCTHHSDCDREQISLFGATHTDSNTSSIAARNVRSPKHFAALRRIGASCRGCRYRYVQQVVGLRAGRTFNVAGRDVLVSTYGDGVIVSTCDHMALVELLERAGTLPAQLCKLWPDARITHGEPESTTRM